MAEAVEQSHMDNASIDALIQSATERTVNTVAIQLAALPADVVDRRLEAAVRRDAQQGDVFTPTTRIREAVRRYREHFARAQRRASSAAQEEARRKRRRTLLEAVERRSGSSTAEGDAPRLCSAVFGDEADKPVTEALRAICADKDYEAPFLKLKLIAQRLRVPGYSSAGLTRADLCRMIATHLNETYRADVDPAEVAASVGARAPVDEADRWPTAMFDPVAIHVVQDPVFVPFEESEDGRVLSKQTYDMLVQAEHPKDPLTRRPFDMRYAARVPPFERLARAYSTNTFGVPLLQSAAEDPALLEAYEQVPRIVAYRMAEEAMLTTRVLQRLEGMDSEVNPMLDRVNHAMAVFTPMDVCTLVRDVYAVTHPVNNDYPQYIEQANQNAAAIARWVADTENYAKSPEFAASVDTRAKRIMFLSRIKFLLSIVNAARAPGDRMGDTARSVLFACSVLQQLWSLAQRVIDAAQAVLETYSRTNRMRLTAAVRDASEARIETPSPQHSAAYDFERKLISFLVKDVLSARALDMDTDSRVAFHQRVQPVLEPLTSLSYFS